MCMRQQDPDGFYYCSSMCCTMFLALTYMLRAAILMMVLMYSWHINFIDTHIILCTVGFHFFSAEAIMSLNYANGWTRPMRMSHRKCLHIFLQICGMACVGAGTAAIITDKGISESVHGITGLVAIAFACASVFTGPCSMYDCPTMKLIHMTIGMPTFLASSVSLCFGCLTDDFLDWVNANIVLLGLMFITFYTVFIVGTIYVKCVWRYFD